MVKIDLAVYEILKWDYKNTIAQVMRHRPTGENKFVLNSCLFAFVASFRYGNGLEFLK